MVALLAACQGGGGSGDAPSQPACKTGDPGPAPLRRLTRFELGRALEDALGVDPSAVAALPPDELSSDELDNNANAYSVSASHVNGWMDLAEGVASSFFAGSGPVALAGCDPTADGPACLDTFVRTAGRRLFRRPLTEDETRAFGDLAAATAGADPREGPSAALTAMLQSASFLYRPENAQAIVPSFAREELATRLSFLLVESIPDDALLAAAAAGRLEETTGLTAETERLLATPRAEQAFEHFVVQWWELGDVLGVQKDPQLFRTWSPDMPAALAAETRLFLADLWERGPTLAGLLTSPRTFVDERLAGFYGDPSPVGGGYAAVTRGAERATGLLGQGAFLAVHAKANQTSPVLRGKFVRARLLCAPPPPPPSDRIIVPPNVDPRLPSRARFAAHAADPFCAGCHRMMDPLGFAFEHHDAVGRWRETDADTPVDASGALTGTDVDGPFDGLPELAGRLAQSAEVRTCAARMWFRWAFGRDESSQDDLCAIDALSAALRDHQGDLRALARATVLLPAFRAERASSTR